ncbi:MAG: ABC transporter ATP-binding protein [Filomicrobium sp.]
MNQTEIGFDALSVENVSHNFGELKALDDVSLSVPAGSFTVLLGLNGAGKSTLFSLVTRLYDNTSGSISILGHDVRRQPTVALQHLGVVFQARTLDADLSLQQNLTYHAALHGLGPGVGRERAQEALELVGLQDRAHEKIRHLSGGQARRVEIARSMLHHPGLLLLDEPTVGLDVGSRESVIEIVRSLVKLNDLGVLWATHLIDEIKETDSIVVLHKGKVLYTGSVPGLREYSGADNVQDAFRILTNQMKRPEAA